MSFIRNNDAYRYFHNTYYTKLISLTFPVIPKPLATCRYREYSPMDKDTKLIPIIPLRQWPSIQAFPCGLIFAFVLCRTYLINVGICINNGNCAQQRCYLPHYYENKNENQQRRENTITHASAQTISSYESLRKRVLRICKKLPHYRVRTCLPDARLINLGFRCN